MLGLYNIHVYLSLFNFVARAVERLSRHRDVLKQFIECQYGLIDCLRPELTLQQYDDITEQRSNRSKQNEVLLSILLEADITQHEAFLGSLRDTYQEHLASYIESDGGRPTVLY